MSKKEPPTIREILDETGRSSTSSIRYDYRALEMLGKINLIGNKPYLIGLRERVDKAKEDFFKEYFDNYDPHGL